MTLHSRFRFWAFLPVALSLLVFGLLAFITEHFMERQSLPPLVILVLLAFLIFAWIWLVFGELRTKVIKVRIEGDEVIVFGAELPVNELADLAQSIPYDILTGISQRVKRVYFEE